MKKIISVLVLLFLCLSIFADINDDLIKAAEVGDVAKVQQFIQAGADVNAMDDDGYTALYYVDVNDHDDII